MKKKSVQEKTGIMLDLGCGSIKRPGFTGLDMRDLPEVDIVHNLEDIPYPLEDECVITMVASQIIEHIKPWLFLGIMDEWWRIAKVGCQLAISMPYGVSGYFLQDPTHCNPKNEATWMYFDPDFPLYKVYEPKPWKITFGPLYQSNGMMEVVLTKRKEVEVK